MKKYLNFLKFDQLQLVLIILTALAVLYLGSYPFREIIFINKIDPVMLTGFISAFTLLFAFFQGAKERRFSYKMAVASKFEEMAFKVIAKLLEAEARRTVFVRTVRSVLTCMRSSQTYRDGNDVKSPVAFNNNVGETVSAISVYFPDEGEKWNEIVNSLTEMGTITSTVLLNYEENGASILAGPMRAQYIQTVEGQLQELERIDTELGNKPLEINDAVIERVNEYKLRLSNA